MKFKFTKALAVFALAMMLLCSAAYAAVDIYTVQFGDTLWIIAQKYMIPVKDIIDANPQLDDPDNIRPGQKISVPYEPYDPPGDTPGRYHRPGYTHRPVIRPTKAPQPTAIPKPAVTPTPAPTATPKPVVTTTAPPRPVVTTAPASAPPVGTSAPSANALSLEEQVVALCNQERAKQGLAPLTINSSLMNVARVKAQDMRDKNYFDHTSPTYGSPFDMLKKFGVSYRTAGENIAKGQRTAQAVVNAWMASEGHKKNILSAGFTQIGVGYAEGNGTTYWAQLFIAQ